MKKWIVVLLVLSVYNTMNARVYYVSPSGNDANAGTEQSPWQTIGKANGTLVPGDSVLMMAGRYHEQIYPQRSGQAGNEIVYARRGLDNVVIDGIPSSLEVAIITRDHIVLDGLTIQAQAFLTLLEQHAYWVRLDGNYVTMRNCRVVAPGDPQITYWQQRAYSRGIVISGMHDTIENSFIRGQMMGIVIAGTAPRYVTLRYDTLFAHGASNVVIISPTDGGSQLQGNLIEYCLMDTSFEEDNIQFEPNYDDMDNAYNRGTVIRKNRLANAAENCLDFKGAADIILEGNLLYGSFGDNDGPADGPNYEGNDDWGGAGIHMGAWDVSNHVIVRENVVWDNHTGGKAFDRYYYYNNVFLNNRKSYRGSNSTNTSFDYAALEMWNFVNHHRSIINNIVVGQPNSGVLAAKIYWGQKLTLDHNLYYDNQGPITVRHDMEEGYITLTGLKAWQDILASAPGYAYLGGKEAHSIEADPQFLNAPVYAVGYDPDWNFSVSLASPAIAAGRCATVATLGGTNSTALVVENALYFSDGFNTVSGDVIRIGDAEAVRISAIDYDNNVITLESPRTWAARAGVHTYFSGAAPNMGLSSEDITIPEKEETVENPPDPTPAPATDLISNGSFESGLTGWSFYSSGAGSFTSSTDAPEGLAAGKVSIATTGNNMQLYQVGIALSSSSNYRLTFSARSNTGHDFSLSMMQDGEPYTNYGLSSHVVDVESTWHEYSIEFETTGFTDSVTNGYLRMWFTPYAVEGDEYLIDNVTLTRVEKGPVEGTAVDDIESGIPDRTTLNQNYPNPFNPETRIRFELAKQEHVTLKVYDVKGAEVSVLVDGPQLAGAHETVFSANSLASGTYICVMRTDSRVETRKMLLVR